ncbi:MAG: hypothetical protein HY698_08115 [Deltaproteobacteria bacterium]|nr:hypothetical protein [Deltaproteobacteria bacterium]
MSRSAHAPAVPTSTDAAAFLAEFRRQHSAAEVNAHVEWLRRLRVLVVGETILDEYVSCDAMGKSGKEPMLVMRYRSRQRYAGGVLAVANHVAEFCDHVTVLSSLGDSPSHEDFVRDSLRSNIRPQFITRPGTPTILKQRFVDTYTRSKLFGVYQLEDEPLGKDEEDAFLAALEPLLARNDVVIVADYGHGLITPRAIDEMSEHAKFLAVNTQLNAANIGFHTISKYPRADYISVHEGEIRLDTRSLRGDLEGLVVDVSQRLHAKTVMVTRGRKGTLLFREGEGFFHCPALAEEIVDRVGAGDAVLALTSLCAAAAVPTDVIGFLGNLAGAQAVAIMGNSSSISRAHLLASVDGLMQGRVARRATR